MRSQDWENWRNLSNPRRSLGRFAWRWPTLALVLALAGVTFTSRHWQPILASWRLQRSLEAATDDEAALLLRQSMELGSPGMTGVVEQLNSPRRSIRRQARATLRFEIDSWAHRPAASAAQRSLQLASALSGRVERLSPLARVYAMQLASEVLQHAEQQPGLDRDALVAACRKVMAVAANDSRPGVPRDSLAAVDNRYRAGDSVEDRADTGGGLPGAAEDRSARRSQPPPSGFDPMDMVAPLPGGGIPVGPLPGPQQAPGEAEVAQSPAPPEAPRLLEVHGPLRPLEAMSGPRPDRGSGGADARPTSASDAEEPPLPPGELVSATDDRTERDEPPAVIRLLSRLHHADDDPRSAVDARRKLTESGFTPQQIEIGMHLTAPDPGERRRWTEVLPRLSGIEAKPWLLWLSRDPDAQVRLAAVSLMATTNDVQMLSRVRELARDDEDDRVRETAQRIGDGADANPRR